MAAKMAMPTVAPIPKQTPASASFNVVKIIPPITRPITAPTAPPMVVPIAIMNAAMFGFFCAPMHKS